VASLYDTEGIFARGRKGFFAASLVKMGEMWYTGGRKNKTKGGKSYEGDFSGY
jgi:hypothetical protein